MNTCRGMRNKDKESLAIYTNTHMTMLYSGVIAKLNIDVLVFSTGKISRG